MAVDGWRLAGSTRLATHADLAEIERHDISVGVVDFRDATNLHRASAERHRSRFEKVAGFRDSRLDRIDVVRRNQQIDVLGGAGKPVHRHRDPAAQRVVEAARFERVDDRRQLLVKIQHRLSLRAQNLS